MNGLRRWSGFAREFNLRWATHRAILALAVLGGLVAGGHAWLGRGLAALEVLRWGAVGGFTPFLAWVIARELDPDHPRSALLAALFALPMSLAIGSPDLWLAFWMILCLRLINRSTGLPARPLDTLAVMVLSIWIGYRIHPALVILAALALIVDGALSTGHPAHLLLGGGIGIAGAVALLLQPAPWSPDGEGVLILGLGVVTGGYCFAVLTQQEPVAVGDYSGETLSAARVRLAQVWAATVGWLMVLIRGMSGVGGALTVWAALSGVAGFELARRALDKASEDRK